MDLETPPKGRTREEVGRDNYCRMMGHDFTVGITAGAPVLVCRNHCWLDLAFTLVPR